LHNPTMYISSTILLLPLLASADVTQEWIDRASGWFDKAKSFAPQQVFPEILDAGAAQVSAKEVQKISVQNWQRKLSPKPEGPEDWLIFVTGNRTCHGSCQNIEAQWNKSVPLLVASNNAPHLGVLNCDKQDQLCTAWAASVPSFWHLQIAQKSTPQAPSPIHITHLNSTTVTAQEILALHTEKKILEEDEFKGYMHPIDGELAKYQLLMPLGYVLWLFGSIPSWAFMIGISFFSRQFMSKKMQQPQGVPVAGAAGPAVPAPAHVQAGRVKPKKG